MSAYDPLDADADPFRPPKLSVIVGCLHCGEQYDSYRIEWRVEADSDGRHHGFWCCPIENCDGKGFGFDIFPVDPEYRDENGERMWIGDDEEDEGSNDPEDEASHTGNSDEDSVREDDDESLPW